MAVDHATRVVTLSVLTNVAIVMSMAIVVFSSHSLALISALMENMVDLFVQGLLWYANYQASNAPDMAKFPAGTSRFEPILVVLSATIMSVISVIVIYESSMRLHDGFASGEPDVAVMSTAAIAICSCAIAIKVGLVIYAGFALRLTQSSSVKAIQQDNINDTVSNAFAIVVYVIAASDPSLWYIDPAGAILIFLAILVIWVRTAKEQVLQLVGVSASPDFIDVVKELCENHHASFALDIIRAYHFGNKYLVELEVVAPATMTVKQAHDISLQLQFKIEQLEDVERAFVHVDYQTRAYDEHVVSRLANAVDLFGGDGHELSTLTPRRLATPKATEYELVHAY
ncbi:hypothetical protein SPRG_06805 [Saprolegnia parasitica CBS 223.65]|uniref:Uncharacterized protein n=1 Tax=Saprolegnia parasitica (strain CBS 223.65) TaxID=695850 RepID=A0A067CAK4_SAPPC|nr:hypothetical protein SPRG_06805 [Saprolegnia parasitica CBS 223.65]KDO27538.1 hypothetical protein SPRG_06805 [Saprolegnia parasitica CBS 223.65]|eukprot:XP_012201665.1 hypothetical protein SPRG_06805 [Saprolegnia parasitica CBS 223.65]